LAHEAPEQNLHQDAVAGVESCELEAHAFTGGDVADDRFDSVARLRGSYLNEVKDREWTAYWTGCRPAGQS